MDTLSIKIKISDRIYPIKVEPKDEKFVRQASKVLEERIRDYQTNFRIQDQQDLLAMVAFDCMVESLKMQRQDDTQSQELMQKIDIWGEHITQELEKKD